MIKAILFDLDGTLLDTVPDIRRHLNHALENHGYPPITIERAMRCIGDGAEALVRRALPDEEHFGEVFRDFLEYYANNDNSLTRLYEGEREFLERALKENIKLAIVTNKPQTATLGCVKKFFTDIPFAFVAGDSGMFPCKPDPTLARYAALSMHVSIGECAFVGDGETDAKTAINAEMFGVSTLWGYRPKEELERAGATRFASTFDELWEILRNS